MDSVKGDSLFCCTCPPEVQNEPETLIPIPVLNRESGLRGQVYLCTSCKKELDEKKGS